MRRGFTVVELLITLAVMAILLSLAVVNIQSSLVSARDKERENDIATIARGLEAFHKSGNPYITTRPDITTAGTYPGVYEFLHMSGTDYCPGWASNVFTPCSGGTFEKALPGVNTAALTPPDMSTSTRGIYVKGELSMQDDDAVLDKLNAGYYVYIPIDITDPGNVCQNVANETGGPPCLAFILKYKEESTGQIIQVKSKYQQ